MLLRADRDRVTGQLTARVRYNRFLWAGVAWRHDDAVALLLGAEFSNIFIGYSYDRVVADVSRRGRGQPRGVGRLQGKA